MKPTVKPTQLRPGDTIAIVAPSSGFASRFPRRMDRAIGWLEHAGFTVRVMSHARQIDAWVSATIDERVADLHEAFADSDVRAVIATLGGNHSAQLLSSLDYELIQRNPKIVCGYSDITSLLHGIHVETGLVTFYGPAALPQFGEFPEPLPETMSHFQHVLQSPHTSPNIPILPDIVDEFIDWGRDETRPRRRRPSPGRQVIREGEAEGRLLPGCLPTLRHLVGTPWQPDVRGALLAIDIPDGEYSASDADADLWHLRNAGLLEQLSGLIVGRVRSVSSPNEQELFETIMHVTSPFAFPILGNLEFGHADPILTLPVGTIVGLSGSSVTALEPAVSV
jgi:muramoyltetrapeptide carboxypeptidase